MRAPARLLAERGRPRGRATGEARRRPVFDTASGSLGGTAFTNQLVTLRFVGDTTDPGISFFVNETFIPPAAGIGGSGGSILDTFSSVFATYDGRSAIGPITGPEFINAGTAFATTAGDFIIDSAGANSTFTASVGTTAVPEPEAVGLLGLGLLAAVAARRRKSIG